MKKLYSIAFLFAIIASFMPQASAFDITYKWNIPGALEFRAKSANGAVIPVADDVTEHTCTSNENGYIYAVAKPGYIITQVVANGTAQKVSAPGTYGSMWGKFFTEDNAANFSPVEVTLEKVEYNIPMKVIVENGAKDVSVQLSPLNRTLDIVNGEQTVYFSKHDEKCYISPLNGLTAKDIYSVEVNGEKLKLKYAWSNQYDFTPTENAELKIRVYENEEPVKQQYVLSLDAPKGAVASVFNRTASSGLITDFTEENLTFNENDKIQVNFDPEFNITTLTVNGEDYLEQLNNNNIAFNITANTTVKVEGSVKQYGTIVFDAYIVNPEGVRLYQGGYQQNLFEGVATETTTEDAIVDKYTFPAGKTYILHPQASEKNPKIFVEANEGWYIKTVLSANEKGKIDVNESVIDFKSNGKTFYVIAEKFETPAKFELIMPQIDALFKHNTAQSQNWGNPSTQYTVKEGVNTINYLPGYHDPFTMSLMDENACLYVDGVRQNVDDNNLFHISPVFNAEEGIFSTAIVYATSPKTYAVTFKGEAIASSDIYYGTARKAVTLDNNNRTTVLPGMILGFKLPEACQAVVATQDGSQTYTAADADAKGYIVIAPEATTKVTIEKAAPAANLVPVTLNPESGAVTRKISAIKVMMPVPENYEHSYFINSDDFAKITLTDQDGSSFSPTSLGDVSLSKDETMYVFPLQFEPAIATAGKYTLDIPAEIIYETAWDEAAEANVRVTGGNANAKTVAEYTVDPNAPTAFSTYELNPAAGNVESIETIYLNFPNIPLVWNVTYPEFVELTNGEASQYCMIVLDWNSETLRFKISPVDENDEPVVLTSGEWTLNIPEGSIEFDGESNAEITAKYTVGNVEPSYTLEPSNDKTVFNLGTVKVTFKDAKEVTYNDSKIITLEGEGYSAEFDYIEYNGNTASMYFTAPDKAGDYTLTIPAGAFTVDGTACEQIVAVYNFTPAYVLNPAPMSTVKKLNELTISFPEFTDVEFVGASYQVLAMSGNVSSVYLTVSKVEGADVPTFRFSPADETVKLPNGMFTLRIEEGVFTLDGAKSPAISAYYQLDAPVSVDWTATPDKCVVFDPDYIGTAIVFDEGVRVSRGENYKDITITLNDTQLSLSENVYLESNFFMINIMSGIELGDIKLHIPAGALSLSGTPCGEIDYTWTIIENKEIAYTVTPAAGEVKDLSSVVIEFNEATSAVVFRPTGASLRSKDYKHYYTGVIEEVADAEKPTFKISFSNDNGAPSVQTNYVLDIVQGTFTVDDYYQSPEIKANYTLVGTSTGIEDVIAGQQGEDVIYTLQGVKLNVEWDELPAGLYIRNGKKVYKY